MAASSKARLATLDRQGVIDRTTDMLAVQSRLSCIANVPEFDLRRVQDIKYILVALVCPRDFRKSVLLTGIGGQALKEARRGCFDA
jgi:hypothetical protein